MPLPELLAGLVLILLVAVAVELAETSARLRVATLRYRDRIDAPVAPRPRSLADRAGGVALAAVLMWFFALPWAAGSAHPAWALGLFFGMFVLGVGLLGRLSVATVRYPLAAFAPLAVVAGTAAMT